MHVEAQFGESVQHEGEDPLGSPTAQGRNREERTARGHGA